jgi:hypothetical protein
LLTFPQFTPFRHSTFTTQLFFEENGTVTFFGDAEAFNDLFETDSLPKEVVDQNPDLPTFTRVFGDVARK